MEEIASKIEISLLNLSFSSNFSWYPFGYKILNCLFFHLDIDHLDRFL